MNAQLPIATSSQRRFSGTLINECGMKTLSDNREITRPRHFVYRKRLEVDALTPGDRRGRTPASSRPGKEQYPRPTEIAT